MFKLCLNFNKTQLVYAYTKMSVCTNYHRDRGKKTWDIRDWKGYLFFSNLLEEWKRNLKQKETIHSYHSLNSNGISEIFVPKNYFFMCKLFLVSSFKDFPLLAWQRGVMVNL